MKKIVSFDFDDTLLQWLPCQDMGTVEGGPNLEMVVRLKELFEQGCSVLVVSTRSTLAGMSEFIEAHSLPVAGKALTQGELKADTLQRLGVTLHHDDDPLEIAALPPSIEGVLVPVHPSWNGFKFK